MPHKSQKDDNAEDTAIWSPTCTHALLVLLDEHVKKNHGHCPTTKDFKVMAEKISGTCYKRYVVTQINQNILG